MVRLSEILKREEIARVNFREYNPITSDKLDASFGVATAENLYKDLLNMMRQVISDILNAKHLNLEAIKGKINFLIDFVSKDDGSLLRLIDRYDDLEDYLVVNGVNVCILALEMGRGLNYSRSMLQELGLGALLHDIGMIKVRNILQNKRQLFAAEYDEVKEHVTYGVQILNIFTQINDKITSILTQHHERSNGSGYLKGLRGDDIDEFARIVGLADVYEAMIHSRPHRNKFVPFEYKTIREIISNRDMFDPYILKVFLERLTRHPAYILWLATNGIYELLEQRKNEQPAQSEIKVSGKKKPVLIVASLALAAVAIAISVLKSNINLAPREVFYPLGNSLGIAENKLPLRITYNFINNPTTHSASLDLTGINLQGYYVLSFSSKLDDKQAKKMRFASLKISVENARKEQASYYLQGLSNRWREFRIPLSYLDTITDWSSLNSINFILQPWNIDGKEGAVYIDNIHFFRKK